MKPEDTSAGRYVKPVALDVIKYVIKPMGTHMSPRSRWGIWVALAVALVGCGDKGAPQLPTTKGAYLVGSGDEKVILHVIARNGMQASERGRIAPTSTLAKVTVVTERCGELEFLPALGVASVLPGGGVLVCPNCMQVGAGGILKRGTCPLSLVEGQMRWLRVDE